MPGDIKLNPDQLKLVNQALRLLHDVVPVVQALAACGQDCSTLMEQVESLNQSLTAWKVHFSK